MALSKAKRRVSEVTAKPSWTFLSNHAHVLLCIARRTDARMREVAAEVGITERAVQRIVAELEEAGYLRHQRAGRSNRYRVNRQLKLRHPIEAHCRVSELIRLVEHEGSAPPIRFLTSR